MTDESVPRFYPRALSLEYFGWYGVYAGVTEGICAPMNEVEGYNKGFRDPGQAKNDVEDLAEALLTAAACAVGDF